MSIVRTYNLNEKQKKLAKQSFQVVHDKFLSRIDDISLSVIGSNKLLKIENLYGDMEWQDRNYRPRQFKMRIDTTQSIGLFARTLLHELVHLKQFAKGELTYHLRDSVASWRPHREKVVRYKPTTDYWDLPWEIEAHGRETGLLTLLVNKHEEWRYLLEEIE